MFILYIKFAARLRKVRQASFIESLVKWIESNKEELKLEFKTNTIDTWNYLDTVISEVIK